MAKRPFRLPRRGNYKAVNSGLGGGWRSGGGGGPSSPGEIDSVEGWWDASSTIYQDTGAVSAADTDGQNVRRWDDQVAAYSFQNPGADPPNYETDKSASPAVVKSVGAEDFTSLDLFNKSASDSFSWLWIGGFSANPVAYVGVMGRTNNTTGTWYIGNNAADDSWFVYMAEVFNGNRIEIDFEVPVVVDQTEHFVVTYGGNSLASGVTIYRNGTDITSSSTTVTDTLGASDFASATSRFNINAIHNFGSSAGTYTAEAAVFNTALSADEVSSMWAYHQDKYGL